MDNYEIKQLLAEEEELEEQEFEEGIHRDKRRIIATICIIVVILFLAVCLLVHKFRDMADSDSHDTSFLKNFIRDVYTEELNDFVEESSTSVSGSSNNSAFDGISAAIAKMVASEVAKTNMFTSPQIQEIQTYIDNQISAAGPAEASPQVVKEITTMVENRFESNYENMSQLHEQIQEILAESTDKSDSRYKELKEADDSLKAWLDEAKGGLDNAFAERSDAISGSTDELAKTTKKLEEENEKLAKKNKELEKQLDEITKSLEELSKTTTDTTVPLDNETVTALQQQITLLQNQITELKNVDLTKASNTRADELAGNISSLSGSISTINQNITTVKNELNTSIGNNKTDIGKNTANIEKLQKDVAALTKQLEGLSGKTTDLTDYYTKSQVYTKDEVDGKFTAKDTDNANTYLSKTDANSTYETKNHASSTYETKENAEKTYALKTDLDTLSEKLETVKGDLANKADKAKVEQDLKKINETLATLNNYALKTEIPTDYISSSTLNDYALKGDIPDLTAINQKIDKLNEAVDKDENKKSIQKQINDIKTDIDTILNGADGKSGLNGRIEALEKKYTELTEDGGRIDEVEKKASANESALNDLTKTDGRLDQITGKINEALNNYSNLSAFIKNYFNAVEYKAGDKYAAGSYVIDGNKLYVSTVDGNDTKPANYQGGEATGWKEVDITGTVDNDKLKAINDEITKIKEAQKKLYAAVGTEYSDTATYNNGDLVIKDGVVYESLVDGNKGNLDANNWKKTDVIAEINNLQKDLNGKASTDDITGLQNQINGADNANSIQAQINALKGKVGDTTISDLQQQVTEIQNTLNSLTSDTKDSEGNVVVKSIQNQITDLQNQITNIQSKSERYTYTVEEYGANKEHRLIIKDNGPNN